MKTFYRIVFSMILVQTISLSNANAQVRSILPDNTFGTGGLVLNKINADFTAAPCGMDVQADGKIIQGISGAHYPAVRRFFANGALDTTFGVKGIRGASLCYGEACSSTSRRENAGLFRPYFE